MKYFAVCAVALSLFGCGGGSDSGNTDTSPIQPAPDNEPAAVGLWFGETTTIDGGTAEVAGLVATDGRARFTSLESVETVTANLTFSGADFSSTNAFYFLDGVITATGEVNGSVSGETMTGEASAEGETINFTVNRLDDSDTPAAIDTVSGNYATDTVSVAIDADGMITGSDVYGCVLSGEIAVIDSEVNIYDMSLTVETCGDLNGTYSGLAAYGAIPFGASESVGLVFSVDNGEYELSDFILKG